MEQCKLTDDLTRKWLEPKFVIPTLEKIFGIKFRPSTKIEDMIDKLDLVSEDGHVKIQNKTRQIKENYTVHTIGDYKNNDFVIFFECPFTDKMIEDNNFLNNYDNMRKYIKDWHRYYNTPPRFFIVPSKIVEYHAQKQIKDGNEYYLISKDIVEGYSIVINYESLL